MDRSGIKNADPLVLRHVKWPWDIDTGVRGLLIWHAGRDIHGNAPTSVVQENRPERVDAFPFLDRIGGMGVWVGKLTAPGPVRSEGNSDGGSGTTMIPPLQKPTGPEEIVAEKQLRLQRMLCLVRMGSAEGARHVLDGPRQEYRLVCCECLDWG